MNKKGSGYQFAIISMVCGILGLLTSCFYGGIIGIVGLVYGCFSIKDKKENNIPAVVGITTSVLSILITIFVVKMVTELMQCEEYMEWLRITNNLMNR